MPDDDDRKVKELLDAETEADLARWFGLPSFTQAEEESHKAAAAPVVDDEMQAVIERRQKACASVDPALLEALHQRNEVKPERLIKFEAKIDVIVDTDFGIVDEELIAKAASIAEPRNVEISDELRDDLKECTPQALLRDLHRAELDFEKQFQVIDIAAEQRLDIVAEVATAMATSWKLPELGPPPLLESEALLEGVRADRRRKWTDYLPALQNRRVRE